MIDKRQNINIRRMTLRSSRRRPRRRRRRRRQQQEQHHLLMTMFAFTVVRIFASTASSGFGGVAHAYFPIRLLCSCVQQQLQQQSTPVALFWSSTTNHHNTRTKVNTFFYHRFHRHYHVHDVRRWRHHWMYPRGGAGGEGLEDENSDCGIKQRKDEDNAHDDLPYREYGYRSTPIKWDELATIINGDIENNEPQNLAKLSRSVEQEKRYIKAKTVLLQMYETLYDHILYSKFGIPRYFNNETERWYVPLPSTSTSLLSPSTSLPCHQSVMAEEESSNPTPLASSVSDDLASTSTSTLTPTTATPTTNATLVLVPNEFPYYVEDGIEHWVLWKLYQNITDSDVDDAIQELKLLTVKNSMNNNNNDSNSSSNSKLTNDDDDIDAVDDVLWWENPPHLKSLPQINHVHFLIRRRKKLNDNQK
jgi:Protein of unknown function (DUF3605)